MIKFFVNTKKTHSSCKVVSPLNIPSGKSVISLPNRNLVFEEICLND